MRIDIPDIPGRTNAFSVQFPVPPRDRANGEYNCQYQSRFSDACYALDLDGWKETRFSQEEPLWAPTAPPVPLLFMRPEWPQPRVMTTAEVYRGDIGLYWKPTGIAEEYSNALTR